MDRISGPRNAPVSQTPESTGADAAQSTDKQQPSQKSMGVAQAKDQFESPRAVNRELFQHGNTLPAVNDALKNLGSNTVTLPIGDALKNLGSNTIGFPLEDGQAKDANKISLNIADELRNLASRGVTLTQPMADELQRLGGTIMPPISDELQNLGSPQLTLAQPIADELQGLGGTIMPPINDDLQNLGSPQVTLTQPIADELRNLGSNTIGLPLADGKGKDSGFTEFTVTLRAADDLNKLK